MTGTRDQALTPDVGCQVAEESDARDTICYIEVGAETAVQVKSPRRWHGTGRMNQPASTSTVKGGVADLSPELQRSASLTARQRCCRPASSAAQVTETSAPARRGREGKAGLDGEGHVTRTGTAGKLRKRDRFRTLRINRSLDTHTRDGTRDAHTIHLPLRTPLRALMHTSLDGMHLRNRRSGMW